MIQLVATLSHGAANMPVIYTIGYEGTSLPEFLTRLASNQIELVIDVRELPLSRRKGFSKRAISCELARVGVDYVHLKSLGDPKEGRMAAREGREAEFRRIFGKHMRSDEAQKGLAVCAELAAVKRSALLCFERCHDCCHRSIVADNLKLAYSFRVHHIVAPPQHHGSTTARRSRRVSEGRAASRS
jgi:uncharacterized protein (DUF488 family)